ncbi:MAG: aldehyde dehydrogenase family protein, partial [Rickettsiales bacterium]
AHNEDGAIDNPLDERTKVGAMDKGGFYEAQAYLDAARRAGAEVIGGNRIYEKRFPGAYYMTPALVLWEGVPEEEKNLMHKDEVFAPIANLERINSLKEAIDKTNRSTEHLSGGFYCDQHHIEELAEFIRSTNLGSLIHNGPPKDLSPFGVHAGRQDGGIGITGSLKSLDQYMRPKQDNNIRLLARVDYLDDAKGLADALLAER